MLGQSEVTLSLAAQDSTDEAVVSGPKLPGVVKDYCKRKRHYSWLETTIEDWLNAEPRATFTPALTEVFPQAEDQPALWVRTRDLCGDGSVDVLFDTTSGTDTLKLPWRTFVVGTEVAESDDKRLVKQVAPFEQITEIRAPLLLLLAGVMCWQVNLQMLPPLNGYERVFEKRLPEARRLLFLEFQVLVVSVWLTVMRYSDRNAGAVATGFSNMDQRVLEVGVFIGSALLASVWWAWALLVTVGELKASQLDRIMIDSWRRFFMSQVALRAVLSALPCAMQGTAAIASMGFTYMLSLHVVITTLLTVFLLNVSFVMVEQYQTKVLKVLLGIQNEPRIQHRTDQRSLLMLIWAVSVFCLLQVAWLDFASGLLPLCGTFFPGNGSVFVFMVMSFVLFSATTDARNRIDTHVYLLQETQTAEQQTSKKES